MPDESTKSAANADAKTYDTKFAPAALSDSGDAGGAGARPSEHGVPPLRIAGCSGKPLDNIVMQSDASGEAASHVRAIRSKILASASENPLQAISVTSSSRHEGKTTVSINLAIALSEMVTGRVAIVDGDFLGPHVHVFTNVRPKTGLVDVLREGGHLTGHVYETQIPRVDIVPGISSKGLNGSEAMLALKCGDILAELRRHYKYIVVDTPPIFSASHARIFASHTDGTVLIARLEQTPREILERVTNELVFSGAKIIGCVLTHRKNHIPNLVYRFFGSTPSHYYYYNESKRGGRP